MDIQSIESTKQGLIRPLAFQSVVSKHPMLLFEVQFQILQHINLYLRSISSILSFHNSKILPLNLSISILQDVLAISKMQQGYETFLYKTPTVTRSTQKTLQPNKDNKARHTLISIERKAECGNNLPNVKSWKRENSKKILQINKQLKVQMLKRNSSLKIYISINTQIYMGKPFQENNPHTKSIDQL